MKLLNTLLFASFITSQFAWSMTSELTQRNCAPQSDLDEKQFAAEQETKKKRSEQAKDPQKDLNTAYTILFTKQRQGGAGLPEALRREVFSYDQTMQCKKTIKDPDCIRSSIVYRSADGTPKVAATTTHFVPNEYIDERRGHAIYRKPVMQQLVKIWNMETGACEHVMQGHTGIAERIMSYTTLDNKTKIVTGALDRTLRIWDEESGNCENILFGVYLHVKCLASYVTSDNAIKIVAGLSDPGLIRIWDATTGILELSLEGHTNDVSMIKSLVVDGKTKLVSCAFDGTARIWDVVSGTCDHVLHHENEYVQNLEFYTQDNVVYLISTCPETIKIWDTRSGTCVCTLKGPKGIPRIATYILDNTIKICGAFDGICKIWDTRTKQCEHEIITKHFHSHSIIPHKIGDTLKLYVSGYYTGGQGTISVIDAQNGKVEQVLKKVDWLSHSLMLHTTGEKVNLISTNHDGYQLFSSSSAAFETCFGIDNKRNPQQNLLEKAAKEEHEKKIQNAIQNTPQPSIPSQPQLTTIRNRWPWIVGGAGVCALAAGLFYIYKNWRR